MHMLSLSSPLYSVCSTIYPSHTWSTHGDPQPWPGPRIQAFLPNPHIQGRKEQGNGVLSEEKDEKPIILVLVPGSMPGLSLQTWCCVAPL